MLILGYILVCLVALEHFFIAYLEMFAIQSKTAQRVFQLEKSFIEQPKALIVFANLGLYNAFLALGLIFSLFIARLEVTYFFLTCILIAAIYGAVTANKSILIKQGLPAFLAIIVLFIA